MGSSIVKSISASALFTLVSGITIKTIGSVITYPTNRAKLESLNYKTLFEVKRDQFIRWREVFVDNKEELIRLIPNITESSTDNEGAYLLKHWCNVQLKSKYDPSIFNDLKRYCTLNIKAALLEAPNTQSIDGIPLDMNKKEMIFNKYEERAIKQGILSRNQKFEDLVGWCKDNFILPYIPSSYGLFYKVKEFCLTPESKF
ncbi:hypothetical protein HF1_11040 [Mycoplasma haemofelis str. Langford 1]|uniref:Uncharacterized protein n=1 Tax=Mycoplasma haemofelis (strain Langford 1) TaxID=941640 RepID=E8ZIZ1_MYCHL|nr:hypothetical protein [Mycoplasma haemofelis]CBY93112.1 hypothetical protein HF1_11040 [Mycoplasma haemofelis str. Langford 1]